MRKVLAAALLGLTALAAPVRAEQEYKTIIGNDDFNMILGYKMWINNWSSWNVGNSGSNYVQVSKGGVMNTFNTTLRFQRFFTNLAFTVSPEYEFPRYTDFDGTTDSVDLFAKRNEIDWNVGAMVVPQLGFTIGLKHVNQEWTGSTNGGPVSSPQDWNWFGPTLGILGSASIGNGFSIYGNGAGGFMTLTRDPEFANADSRSDGASYESAELGLAWRAKKAPISASFGYKFQRINTKLDETGFRNLRGVDITSGYTLGLNVIF